MLKMVVDNLSLKALNTFPPDIIKEIIHNLPKIDLHRHLEGSISPETMLELARDYAVKLPTNKFEDLIPLVQYTDKDSTFLDFMEKFKYIGQLFNSYETIQKISYNAIQDAIKENLKYLELRFSPIYIANYHNLDPKLVVEAVIEGAKLSAKSDIRVNFIIIIERQWPIELAWKAYELALLYKTKGVVALDLANDELNYPPELFTDIFIDAKKEGLNITIHAGEAVGPKNIHTAITKLKADRIGHGVRLIEDPIVENIVKEHNIPLELCYTSNLQTHVIDNYKEYPLKHYLDKGLIVTINTDDPAISGIDLNTELINIIKNANLTLSDIYRISTNANSVSFRPENEKASYQKILDNYIDIVQGKLG
jgi:adenosine deaminase